ncbi:hypothetical protein B296_00044442 [Ensete ventricosum]|uniref:Uncharacterized protein n=1 Tax=Ensete ventricosum TaxID=4639 RepID=A0A426XWB2_ENSVE|nr:hypothetical protein B296_00044442 [Ensete ventricosum]
MHPLRFPNSGIRAKVFMKKIDFKLRMMILNRVESLYELLLHFRNKDTKKRGWPAMTRPSARVAGHSQAPTGVANYGLATRKGAADCGQGQPAREAGGARKGRQTPTTYRRPPVGAAAYRVPPAGAKPAAGAVATTAQMGQTG